MATITITLNFQPYAVPTGKSNTFNMTPNNLLRSGYSQSNYRRRLQKEASGHMFDSGYYLTLQALLDMGLWQTETPLFLYLEEKVVYDVEFGFKRMTKDEDNATAGLKPILDGVAKALGVDDKRFKRGDVTMTRAKEEYTQITLTW
tara:strand:+ start:220 stop:657 length:438 start_codon:yes stop_codon:yes gene_type:complete